MKQPPSPQRGDPVRVVERLGFRFSEYPDDYDFNLGSGARSLTGIVFVVTAAILLLALVFGIVTPVSVKAPISGQIEPERIDKLFPEIRGRIVEVKVKKGDLVAPGDTVAVLRVEDYEEKLADLQFQRSQAEKRLAQLKEDFANRLDQLDFQIRQQRIALGEIGTSGEETLSERERAVLVSDREFTQAKLHLADAEKKAQASERLFERGLISRDQLEQSRMQRELAQSEYDIKKKGVETARAALATTKRQEVLGGAKGKEELKRLESQRQATFSQQEIEVAGAEHEVAELGRRMQRGEVEVGRRVVESPVAGVVLETTANAGEPASPESPVASVANLDHLVLVAHVPELYRKRIDVGHKAALKFSTYKDYEFRGTVLRISPSAQFIQSQSMYEVRLDVQPPEKLPALRAGENIRLLPGMTATGNVIVQRMRMLKYVVVVKMLKRM